MKPLKKNAIGSGLCVAIVLGEISPKIKRTRVTTNVASPTPAFPNSSMAIYVKIEERAIFTILLPTSKVLISLSLLFNKRHTLVALRFFLFRRSLTRSLFIERNALSVAEKIIERNTRTTEIAISILMDTINSDYCSDSASFVTFSTASLYFFIDSRAVLISGAYSLCGSISYAF